MHARIDENGMVIEWPIVNLRQHLPNCSLPVDLTSDSSLPDGYVYVHSIQTPDFDPKTQKIVGFDPVLIDGRWQSGYSVVALDDAEVRARQKQEMSMVRAERNQKLANCDWTQLPDASVDQAAWAQYRQALRDITAQPGFPESVCWPVAPKE